MSRAIPEPIAIAILAKAPIAGLAKTRLIDALGAEGAAALQARFIRRTVAAAIAAATGGVTLWASPDRGHPQFQQLGADARLRLMQQPEGDLGARMAAAVAHAQGPVVVIGVDCPALTAEHLRSAADDLRSGCDAVLTPADDGGYVLIGMQRPRPELFERMPWGSNVVAAETRRRLRDLGLKWREAASLWDVDRPCDLQRMRAVGLGHLLDE